MLQRSPADPLDQPICVDVWRDKYRYKDEPDYAHTCERVIKALTKRESAEFQTSALRAMVVREIVPAGRILAGAGTDKRVTLINCFVSPYIQDSMASYDDRPGKGIMDALSVAAYSLQMGGGIGMDFSTIRPRGAVVKRTSSVSSGVMPFMDMWHYMSETIMSAGHSRGAMMATLRCLDGSTKIHTLDGNIPISELVGKRPYVFACDPETRRVHVVRAKRVFVSDRKRRVLRLRFDTRSELVCTPDHLIMLKSGTYKPAGKLRVGDRLMAIEHGATSYRAMPEGHNRVTETVKCTDGRADLVYRIVAEDVLLKRPDGYKAQVHHKDRDRLHNHPRNLEVLSVSDHATEHAAENVVLLAEFAGGKGWSDVYGDEWAATRREKQKVAIKKAWRDGKMAKRRNPNHYRVGKTIEELYGAERAAEIRARLSVATKRQMQRYRDARSAARQGLVGKNHRVTAIEDFGVADEVYDISLPKWHNFAANEVFVHNCDHPAIEEFVEAKQKPGRLTNFNVSVLVPDAFMQAVEKDELWNLTFPVRHSDIPGGGLEDIEGVGFVYKRVPARELWDKIISATYVHAEPGVIFIDRINQQNNLAYCEDIHCVNPCGEQALPDNGCCNLGHTNLAVMVDRPFEASAAFNFAKLERSAAIMVRLLDNVLDETLWPTEEQAEEAHAKRRIGLGFTGLASALQQLGIPYGSERAVEFVRGVAYNQAKVAYCTSVVLAKERGAFPLFARDKFCNSPFVKKFPAKLRRAIYDNGIRNGVLLSIAPTGTTSLVVGNVSSGIEPVFAHKYRRKVRSGNGEMENEYSVFDYGYLKFCEREGVDPENDRRGWLPDGFVTADQLTVEQHLQMAAAAQEWVDSAISKTINCPTSMAFDEFKDVYTRAYALGMKGCTTYRPDPQSGRGAVLENVAAASVGPTEEVNHVDAARSAQPDRLSTAGRIANEITVAITETRAPPPADQVPASGQDKIPMQDVVEGRRYRIKWPAEDCAYYITITDCVDGSGRRRPFELFINTKSERHSEWVKAFSLLVTAIFRREGDPSFVVDELRSVFSATGGTWVRVPWAGKPKLATSLVAAIGFKIEEHMRWLGMIVDDGVPVVSEELARQLANFDRAAAVARVAAESLMPATELLDVCIHCGAKAVVYSEGCATCHACGRSDCG